MNYKIIINKVFTRKTILRVKFCKQLLSRVLYGKKCIESKFRYFSISKPNTHVFFGYYDVTPFNSQTEEIIYLNLPEDHDKVGVMLSNLTNGVEQKIAESNAWNWQQGCRLRWMPNNPREIVFNDFYDNRYISRVVNVDTRSQRVIDYPLYDISPDGRYGLTIDFERLGVKRPGYGYTCRRYDESDHNLNLDSIDLVDLSDNSKKTIITYSQITKITGCESSRLSDNYLNHICFSPSGKQFLFFWLTIEDDWHKAYLLVHNFETNKTKLLENKEKVSHYVWQDENIIICTAIDDQKKEHYYRYNVSTGTRETLSPEILTRDGHPSLFGKDILLTDTYPDFDGYQHLYLADIKNSVKKQILSIYNNCMIEGEKRTDLHPRLNYNNTMISFDANIKKYRELYFVNIK